jgi:G:T-mismatch repair DNA endonuclease (very short patch repair protein)
MIKCNICNKEISHNKISYERALFKKHLNKVHIEEFENNLEIEKFFIKTILYLNDNGVNNIIDKYISGFSFMDIEKEYSCSRGIIKNLLVAQGISIRTNSESKKTKQYIDKYTNTIEDRYGVNNISKLESIKRNKEETTMKNYGFKYSFSDENIRKNAHDKIDYSINGEKIKKAFFKKYGVGNPSQVKEINDRIIKSHKKYFEKFTDDEKRRITEKARRALNYESKVQLRVQEIINSLSATYTANAFLYAYNFDFLFKCKAILEIQGEFWHANPNNYLPNDILLGDLKAKDVWDKDKRKKEKVEKHGYKVFYLWENEINNMSDEDIKKFISNMFKEIREIKYVDKNNEY